MTRVTSPDGLIVVITPSAGPVHRYPVDCYRFNLDSMDALARLAGVHLVDAWRSDFGPFCDVVGVFRKNLQSNPNLLGPPDLSLRLAQPAQNSFPDGVPDEVEHGSGTQDCYEFLSAFNKSSNRGSIPKSEWSTGRVCNLLIARHLESTPPHN